jgi:hypothetical protein
MRITESKLRNVIRSVIKESIDDVSHRSLESAVSDVRGDDRYVFDSHIRNHIEEYIDNNHVKDLLYSNTDGHLDISLDQVPSQRLEGDYDKVIANMDNHDYEAMVSSVFNNILSCLKVR